VASRIDCDDVARPKMVDRHAMDQRQLASRDVAFREHSGIAAQIGGPV